MRGRRTVAELRTNERQVSGVELQEKGPNGVETQLGPCIDAVSERVFGIQNPVGATQ